MPLTDDERAAINRRNASKSTGPTSERGKGQSRRNALKHGLRAEALALPNEDPDAVAARADAWNDYYRPQSPAAQHLVNACVAATLLSDRCQKYHEAALAKQVRDAEHDWEVAREEEVAALVALLRADPAAAARGLARTGHGCRWLIARWEALRAVFDGEVGGWTGPECEEALRLQGLRPEGPDLKECPDAWMTRLLNLNCQEHPSDAAVAWIFHPQHLPERYAYLVAPEAPLPTPAECRETLRALAGSELARARALEAVHREGRDDPDRGGAADRALILDDGPSSRLFLRYHAEARTSFQRAYGSLVTALERDAATASPNEATDPPDAPEAPAEGVSPNEADSGASPSESEASEAPPRRPRKSRSDEEPVGVVLMKLLAGQDTASGGTYGSADA
jgi:hypothetical protein